MSDIKDTTNDVKDDASDLTDEVKDDASDAPKDSDKGTKKTPYKAIKTFIFNSRIYKVGDEIKLTPAGAKTLAEFIKK